jgi:hypothetical protein
MVTQTLGSPGQSHPSFTRGWLLGSSSCGRAAYRELELEKDGDTGVDLVGAQRLVLYWRMGTLVVGSLWAGNTLSPWVPVKG